jgi:hypothetical protein
MTGVSGGSLLISGFHLPQFGDLVQGTLLACGGLAPQVAVTDAAAQKLVASRLHFQSTTNGEQSRQWEPCDPRSDRFSLPRLAFPQREQS